MALRSLLATTFLFLTTAASASAASPVARLTISVYPEGTGSSVVHRYKLTCGPASGTVPRPVRACTALSHLTQPFAPLPPRIACAQLDEGPAEAVVTGVVRGQAVSAHLELTSACQIERWRRVSLVVPGFPASA